MFALDIEILINIVQEGYTYTYNVELITAKKKKNSHGWFLIIFVLAERFYYLYITVILNYGNNK